MFTVVVQEKGGKTQRLQFNKNEITVGRVQGNDIVLPKGNVSKRHAKIVYKENKFIVVDLKSTNGTYVNGHKIASPQVIKGSDKVFIGDFVIEIESGADAGAGAPAPAPPPVPQPPPPVPGPPQPPPGQPPRPPVGGNRPPMPHNPAPPPPVGANRPPMPPPQPPQPVQQQPPQQQQPPMAPPVQAAGGGWSEVGAQGGPGAYHYMRIQGGWLVSAQTGLVFIADPQHQFPPVPA